MPKTIIIDGQTLSDKEIIMLEELVEAGFDSSVADWTMEEEDKYRKVTDKYFPNK